MKETHRTMLIQMLLAQLQAALAAGDLVLAAAIQALLALLGVIVGLL